MHNSGVSSLRTAVAGVSGYAGGELARLLLRHPRLASTPPIFLGRLGQPGSDSAALTRLHPELSGLPFADELQVSDFDWKQLQRESVDVLFLATPHEQSREWAPQAIEHGMRVIDLSGAWRLQTESLRAIYKLEDANPATAAALQAEAVYGSPELHGPTIKHAKLVANPGCYATISHSRAGAAGACQLGRSRSRDYLRRKVWSKWSGKSPGSHKSIYVCG